jgi:hypothetical protein
MRKVTTVGSRRGIAAASVMGLGAVERVVAGTCLRL